MRRCGHSKLSKMSAAAILNLFESKIAPLDPPSPKTPPYNQTWSGSDHPLQRYGHSRMLGHMEPPFWGKGRSALSVTIRPQFTIECLRRSNQQGVGHFGPKFRGFPLEQIRHVGVAKSERPRLTKGEIIFEEFQPMWSQSTNVTDGRTDRQTTCDRNTALCTKVHRAVIRHAIKKSDTWFEFVWNFCPLVYKLRISECTVYIRV